MRVHTTRPTQVEVIAVVLNTHVFPLIFVGSDLFFFSNAQIALNHIHIIYCTPSVSSAQLSSGSFTRSLIPLLTHTLAHAQRHRMDKRDTPTHVRRRVYGWLVSSRRYHTRRKFNEINRFIHKCVVHPVQCACARRSINGTHRHVVRNANELETELSNSCHTMGKKEIQKKNRA